MSKRDAQLVRAVASGRLELIAAALRRGASPDARGAQGEAPLNLALQAGNLEAARLLLCAGASPNLPDHRGLLPLIVAIRARSLEAVRILLEAGALASPRPRYHCNLPVIVAVHVGDAEIAFTIGTEGKVLSATDKGSSLSDKVVIDCVARAFAALTFPKPQGGTVNVVYPLVFTQAE